MERVVTRVTRTLTSRCFLTALENSPCPGMCQSRTASRGVSVSLDPTSTKHFRVLGRDVVWTCCAWMPVRGQKFLKKASQTKNASPAVTSWNKLFTSSALSRWTALREAGGLEGLGVPSLDACCCALNARILADRERTSSGGRTSGSDGPD